MSVARRRNISTLVVNRLARKAMSRASGGPVALSWLWPGRTDRLIIAPHDLRTADATRAAEPKPKLRACYAQAYRLIVDNRARIAAA